MNERVDQATPVRERILKAAFDLFYRQGYRATGVNQLISEADVAKASFYEHFPSKDDLLLAYAEEQARLEYRQLKAAVESWSDPEDRFFAAFHVLYAWLKATEYRGCPFQNLVAEVSDHVGPVRKVAERHRENLKRIFAEAADYLKEWSPEYADLETGQLVNAYLLLFEGAIATAVAYRSHWPVDEAIKAMGRFLEKGH